MPRPSLRPAILLAFLLLGVCSQIIQALLVRESLVIFYGNEVSLGVFFGGWLFWVAVGSWTLPRLQRYSLVPNARLALARILLVLPLLVAAQVLAVRGVRLLFDIPSIELVPLGDLILWETLITLPASLALGLAFPLACKALEEEARQPGSLASAVRDVSGLYLVEAVGALAGGVLFTFVMIQWMGVWRSIGSFAVALSLAAWMLSPESRSLRGIGLGLACIGMVLAATPLSDRLNVRLEALRFSTLQPGLALLDAVETRYGHVAIGRLGTQISVVTDGRISESFPTPEDTRQTAAYVYSQAAGARRVLMFGGYAGGLGAELLRYPLERLDLVEQDQQAFEHVRPYLTEANRVALADPRLRLHFVDGRRYLSELSDAGLDLVLVLDAVPTSAHSNRYFTREFYLQVRANLAPDGVLCTQVSSASNYLGSSVRSYSGSVYQTLRSVFPAVAIMPGDTHLYCASREPGRVTEDPVTLSRRYTDTPLDRHLFPAVSFYSLLPAGDIGYARAQLEGAGSEINSDARPVTYYLNMVLWGRFSASGFVDWLERLKHMGVWPYLVPLVAFLGLWLLRCSLQGFQRPRLERQAAAYVLGALGFIAMAAQLAILFAYQARLGFVFERVALLNGLFMTGLAVGTGGLGRRLAQGSRPDAWLAGLMVVVAILSLGLPLLFELLGSASAGVQEAGYLALAALLGLLTGAGFPLGVRQAYPDLGAVTATGAVSEAADSLGGALGGLLTGALLIPLLGFSGTSRLLAVLSLSALLPVLYARYAPVRIGPMARRGGNAFPWSLAGWMLTFCVLTLFGWELALRGSEDLPQQKFDETALAEVSLSSRFQTREAPFPYYLGWDSAAADPGGPADTASLASMAAAAEVRGYAGPINLLVSVDGQGRLRGLRYLESNETPSYIAGIEQWLAGLVGEDMSSSGLDLQRVDAFSGATVSSQAALEAINQSVRSVALVAWGRPLAPAAGTGGAPEGWRSARFLVTAALLLIFIPVYLSGSERARLALQVAVLGILGVWLNSLVTEMDLINLSLGHWPSLSGNPQRWLLLGFALFGGILFGQVWCGYLCPYGALQELVSRLGRRLGLRRYVQRPLDTALRFLKFVLLALTLGLVWLADDTFWASFDPMQHVFGARWEGWMVGLIAVTLLGALFHYRFWCRYFCPVGAFFALSNKISLLQHLAPKRRIEHCDLGVKDEYDIDCIRCNRCLSGRDCGVRHPPRGSPP